MAVQLTEDERRERVASLLQQRETLHKNINSLEEMRTKYGANVPLDILTQLEDARKELERVEQELEQLGWQPGFEAETPPIPTKAQVAEPPPEVQIAPPYAQTEAPVSEAEKPPLPTKAQVAEEPTPDWLRPSPDYRAKTALAADLPKQMLPGEELPVRLKTLNLGDVSWPASGADAVYVGYRVYGVVDGDFAPDPLQERRQPLPQPVFPGEGLGVDITFTAPTATGTYQVAWDLVRGDDQKWFSEYPDGKPLTTTLEVVQLLGTHYADLAAEPSGVRRAQAELVGRLAQSQAGEDLRATVESWLLPALFDSDLGVRKTALLALYEMRERHEWLEDLLRKTFASRQSELAPVRELTAPRKAQAPARHWLESLLPPSPDEEAGRPKPTPVEAAPVTHAERPTPPTETPAPPAAAPTVPGPTAPPFVVPTPVVIAKPPATIENKVSINVGPTTVILEYDGKKYTGPNRIDSTALLAATSVQQYGETLFKAIIHDEVSAGGIWESTTLQGYARAMGDTQRKLHVELYLDPNDLTLHAHKWEYLKHPQETTPLAAYEKSPFYRLLAGPTDTSRVTARPLKVLVAICNPAALGEPGNRYLEKLVKLDAAQERDIVETGLRRLEEAGLAEYRILNGGDGSPVTPDVLREELQEGYHILHVLSHGLFIEGKYYLVMERSDHSQPFVSAEQFTASLSGGDLRLVVLAACQSATSETGDALRGLGPRLVRAGVPAVIAMQDLVPVETAQLFTQHFYDDLARSGSVDEAMAATRLALYQRGGEQGRDWGIPVLLMSTDDGHFFDVDDKKAKKLPDLEPTVKTYGQLAGQGDPTPRRLARAIEAEARASGAGAELLGALRAVVAPTLVGTPSGPEAEPLAPRQNRVELKNRLTEKVNIKAADLKAYVQDEGSGLQLPPEVYEQAASALNAGKHVILIGPPGTGKTSLAQDICEYAQKSGFSTGVTPTTATADWTTFDTVGGYVPTPRQTLQFRLGIFLQAICTGQWLVIDEINRAEIDKAFGELFTVLAGQRVDLPYTVGEYQVRVLPPSSADPENWVPKEAESGYDYVMHPNWRIIATMNVYDKSYLFAMSFAFMRRFAFVDVDVPGERLYRSLLNKWLKKHIEVEKERLEPLNSKLRDMLLKTQNPLMTRRALGPAIAKDMIVYMGDRYGQAQPPAKLPGLLGEAFLLYAVPQLDGLDQDGICAIYKYIGNELFAGGDVEKVREFILARIRSLYPHIRSESWEAALQAGESEREPDDG